MIYSTTDTKAAGPLIKGFEAQYPGVKVEYNDMNSTELYNRYISEQAAGGRQRGCGVELIDGYRAEISHRIRRTICLAGGEAITRLGGLAAKAYGTTYEPVVFIYNKRLIPQNEVPDSHTALAKLIASRGR